ncbi:MAG TPA: phage holin family protein [Thermomicrobiales bacterium]|nr:phage holin family protein [Thermomicrobiales bacterium]
MDRSGSPGRQGEVPPVGGAAGDQGLGSLVSGIVEDLQNIVRGEVRLAKTEMKEEASAMGRAAASIVAGALVALVGFIFLMLGVTYLINQSLEMWLSAGIVGVALLVIGGILAMIGKNRLQAASLKPTQTIDSLKEDQQWANQQIKSVGK